MRNSEPLVNGQTRSEYRADQMRKRAALRKQQAEVFYASLGFRALGLIGIVIGAVLWMLGARYSVGGWVRGINLFGELMGLHFNMQPPTGQDVWLPVVVVGLIYSFAEVKVKLPTMAQVQAIGYTMAALLILLVVIVHGTDIGSTYLEVSNPGPDAWPLHQWAARLVIPIGVWSVLLTYLPELLILFGKRLLLGQPLIDQAPATEA